MQQSYRLDWEDPVIPEQLRLYRRMILTSCEPIDERLTMAPSALPLGRITCSALAGDGTLWFADPQTGLLSRCSLMGNLVESVSALAGDRPVRALFLEKNHMFAATDEAVFRFSVPMVRPVEMRTSALQKSPQYYPKPAELPKGVVEALERSKTFRSEGLIEAIGNVKAVCGDRSVRYVALADGVMQLSAEAAYDRRRVELYHGGRYLFGASPTVSAVASDGEDGIWIENELGYVHVRRFRKRLREKADWYDRLTWELHSVRGSLCDTHYAAENCGNETVEPTFRYSTNNDALWSVFTAIGDAQRYSVMAAEGDQIGARDAKTKFMRVLENVLLQSHVHRFGNGLVCRGYVSKRDQVFVENGHIATNGLWLRSDVDENGNAFCTVEDTTHIRAGKNDAEGKNYLLSDAVKARVGTDSDRMVSESFVLSLPQTAEVPARLAELYRKPDPYRPEKYPASEDSDIIFKTDTSSEEVIAAFIMYYFAWKHFLKNPVSDDDRELLALTRATIAAVITHLLDNDLRLVDVHGNSTQWGKWFVDYFADWDGPDKPWRHPSYAYTDAALNAAEWMCMLRVALQFLRGCEEYAAVCARVEEAYELCYAPFDGVTEGKGYAELLATYRTRLSQRGREQYGCDNYVKGINYSDEELAIVTFWPLLELETDVERLKILENGLDEWWENMRREAQPFYSFPYAALRGSEGVDLAAAVDTLNRTPLWLRGFPVVNSTRNDVVMIPPAAEGERPQANRVIPVDERRTHKCNSSPFTVDAEGAATAAIYDRGYLFCGSFFTMPYWTARYYDLLDDSGRKF
ncbi:MAG: hypothetical protein IJC93_01440 [Clostridia bacterium]|nr:hypothetical protein [Clostridia bacterium]